VFQRNLRASAFVIVIVIVFVPRVCVCGYRAGEN